MDCRDRNWKKACECGLMTCRLQRLICIAPFGAKQLIIGFAVILLGLVTLRFRSINTFTQPFVQRPRDFRPPAMNGGGASYRIRVWMPLSMQEGFQIAWNKGSVQSCVRPVYAAFIRCGPV